MVERPAILDWDDPLAPSPRLAPVHRRMRAAVAGGPESGALYGWLRYHLGWAELDGRAVEARRAKGIRPLVCLLAAEAAGGAAEPGDGAAAVDVAAAVELTHEFSLIHDDVEDGDTVRRGRPALWAEVGVAQAVNAGDALFAVARVVLGGAAVPDTVHRSLMARYDAACLALAEGQALDLGFETAPAVAPEAYVAMVRRKTGALLGFAAAAGWLAGGGPGGGAEALARYGEAVGVAFQMWDDVLGLWGKPERTGKPAGADLVRRKRSLPVLLALADPALATDLSAYLDAPDGATDAAAALSERMAAAGLARAVADEARGWVAAAEQALAGLDMAPGPRAVLIGLAHAAVERER
jgi:geranylgeranyl diphosphate synthase type I